MYKTDLQRFVEGLNDEQLLKLHSISNNEWQGRNKNVAHYRENDNKEMYNYCLGQFGEWHHVAYLCHEEQKLRDIDADFKA